MPKLQLCLMALIALVTLAACSSDCHCPQCPDHNTTIVTPHD